MNIDLNFETRNILPILRIQDKNILFKWGLKLRILKIKFESKLVMDDAVDRPKVWIPILFFNQQFKVSFEQYFF